MYNYLGIANRKRVSDDLINKARDVLSLAQGSLQGEILITEDLDDLEGKIQEYKENVNNKNKKVDLVLIFSGDGGVMHSRTRIEHILGYRPLYAAVPKGTQMNIQRAAGIQDPFSYLKFISEKACWGKLEQATVSFPSLDLNGYKGFNVGFGLVPRLLWMYYGKSAEQFAKLEVALKTVEPTEYLETYQKIMKQYPEETVKEKGLVGVCRAAWKTLRGLRNPHTYEGYLLSSPIKGDIVVDGKKKHFRQKPLELYISCYEEANLGLGPLNPKPSPEARAEPGKFQVVAPYGTPLQIALEFPKVLNGKHLSNAEYFFASTIQIQSRIAEIDGEIMMHNGFTLAYDGEVKIISPLADS